MTKFATVTALILAATAPAFAGPSAADIHAQIALESDDRNNGAPYIFADGVSLSTKSSTVAAGIFAQLAAEDDSNNNGLDVTVSSKGGDRAAAIFAQLFAEDESNNNALK